MNTQTILFKTAPVDFNKEVAPPASIADIYEEIWVKIFSYLPYHPTYTLINRFSTTVIKKATLENGLWLKGKQLTGDILKKVGNIYSLKKIHLTYDKSKSVINLQDLEKLTGLNKLSISLRFSYFGPANLKVIHNFHYLEELKIPFTNDLVEAIPFLPKLKSLKFTSFTQGVNFTPSLTSLSSLNELSIDGGFFKTPFTLSDLQRLTTLDSLELTNLTLVSHDNLNFLNHLSYLKISEFLAPAHLYPLNLYYFTRLKSLNLDHTYFSEEFYNPIIFLTTLNNLSIENCSSIKQDFIDNLTQLSQLKNLNIKDNPQLTISAIICDQLSYIKANYSQIGENHLLEHQHAYMEIDSQES